MSERIILTLVMLGVFTGAVAIALTLPSKAAFMPLLVGIPGLLFCTAQLAIDLRAGRSGPREARTAISEVGRRELQMFGWLGLFVVVLVSIGFLWGGPILVALFIKFASKENWQRSLFAGAGTLVVLYAVFERMLELHLFPGLLVKALF